MNNFANYQKGLRSIVKNRTKPKTEIEEVFEIRDGIVEWFFDDRNIWNAVDSREKSRLDCFVSKTINLAKNFGAMDDDGNFIKNVMTCYDDSRNYIYIWKMKNWQIFAVLTAVGVYPYGNYMRIFMSLSWDFKICWYHHTEVNHIAEYKLINSLWPDEKLKYFSGYYSMNDIKYKEKERKRIDIKPLLKNLEYMFENQKDSK